MNLKEIRTALVHGGYLVLRGGTFHYCGYGIDKLDKNGRRTGRLQACGKKLRDESAMRRHIRRHHTA